MSQEQSLMNALDAAGISWAMNKHQAVYTVEESAQLHAEIPGAHTKNLFLKDAAEQFCVVSTPHDPRVDLIALPTRLDLGRSALARPKKWSACLGFSPDG